MKISPFEATYSPNLLKTCSINGETHKKKTLLCYSEIRKKFKVNVPGIMQRIKRWKGNLEKHERASNQRRTFCPDILRTVETKGGNHVQQ
jgi:hypothetical protein